MTKSDAQIAAEFDAIEVSRIISRLKLCGCGQPEIPLRVIREALEVLWTPQVNEPGFHEAHEGRWSRIETWMGPEPQSNLAWFVFYVLDTWKLTDHGGSLPGWLTDDGRKLLKFLQDTDCSREKWDDAPGFDPE